MYIPAAFRENDREKLLAVIERYPLATLVTAGAAGILASHLPMIYTPSADGAGALRGHLAKANPQWQGSATHDALAIFTGPDHYISPSWYPSKQEHGRVVPTWNYAAVHVYGTLHVIEDRAWMLANVTALTERHEQQQGTGWKVEDAPADYIEGLLRAIVGVELRISRWEGKVKASQNRPAADREGLVEGLGKFSTDAAREMAGLVEAESD
jgi:transcriptional regulator